MKKILEENFKIGMRVMDACMILKRHELGEQFPEAVLKKAIITVEGLKKEFVDFKKYVDKCYADGEQNE